MSNPTVNDRREITDGDFDDIRSAYRKGMSWVDMELKFKRNKSTLARCLKDLVGGRVGGRAKKKVAAKKVVKKATVAAPTLKTAALDSTPTVQTGSYLLSYFAASASTATTHTFTDLKSALKRYEELLTDRTIVRLHLWREMSISIHVSVK